MMLLLFWPPEAYLDAGCAITDITLWFIDWWIAVLMSSVLCIVSFG
jgi:hypothetical protein